MAGTQELNIDFGVNCENKTFTKTWATQLVASLKESFEKVTTSINTINSNITQRFDELELNLRKDISDAALKAESAHKLASENKCVTEQLRSEMDILKQWCLELKHENSSLKNQTNNIESYSRRNNIVFHGIEDTPNESSVTCEHSLRRFLQDHLLISQQKASSIPFVRCHRLQVNNNKSHATPIIVRFERYADRELIWSKKSLLTNKNYYVGEDFPKDVNYNRRKLIPVFSKARKIPGMDKKQVSLKSDTLIISGRKYRVDTLDQLTGELDMKTFNQRSNDNLIVFGGIFSNFHPLSNYYLCPIVYKKYRYKNIEQAYQHRKAVLFKDELIASKIMASSDPAEAKRISYELKGSKEHHDKWNAERYDLMLELVKANFLQNPELAKELKNTGTKQLAESGKHQYYATGLSITNRDILNTGKWTGSSKLGEILISVRRELNR